MMWLWVVMTRRWTTRNRNARVWRIQGIHWEIGWCSLSIWREFLCDRIGMVQWPQSSQQLDIILQLTYATELCPVVTISIERSRISTHPGGGIWLADQCIASGRPGRPLTQRTMVAGGLTPMKNDANNDANGITMITVRSIFIDYSQSGLFNRDDRYYKRN